MALTAAIIGYGTLFQTGDGNSPENFTSLAEVHDLSLPPLSADVVDAGHESAPNEWREVLTGLLTAGEISLTCNFIKTTYQTLLAELDDTTPKTRRIVLPGGTHVDFSAYLTGLEVGVAVNDKISANIKLRPTGAPSLTVV